MKTSQKKVVQPTKEQEEDEIKKNEKQKREEDQKQKRREEQEELLNRRKQQQEAAEEVSRKMNKKKSSSMMGYYVVFGLLGSLILYVIIMLFINQQPPLHKTPVIDDNKMDEHNQHVPWRQGPNKIFEGSTLADAKKIINTSFASHQNLAKCSTDDSVIIPDSFDTRTAWPNCKLPVSNQQTTCGSSYALTVSQTISERNCISSKDHKLVNLSAQELLSCDVSNQGCKGGYINNALDYIRTKGIVDETCFPYKADSDNTKCESMCSNPTRERIDGYCILFGEEDIKREIFKNGPVVAVTQVYVDFLTYKSGIYTKSDDIAKFSGFQSVKIIGWGIESGSESEPNKGNKYWIVENTWGAEWGDNGVAKISAGQDLMFDQYAYSIKVKSDKVEVKTSTPSSKGTTVVPEDLNLEDLKEKSE
jgi:cathepsin B